MADDQRRNLWAPWRMEYIRSLADGGSGCFLCDHAGDPAQDTAGHVLWRGPQTLTLLNRFPYSSGHVLVAPLRHVASLEELNESELLELMQRLRDAKRTIEHGFGARGFNIGFNLGACAGAGIPGHIHGHVVPRWHGDVNYMAVIGDVKVIPEALQASYETFLQAARELDLPSV